MSSKELFFYPEGKTNYQIINERGEKTTITLEKWVADILQEELDDVHAIIQSAYNKVLKAKPGLGRRQKGNYIRIISEHQANKFQKTKKKILGWNDQELIELLR